MKRSTPNPFTSNKPPFWSRESWFGATADTARVHYGVSYAPGYALQRKLIAAALQVAAVPVAINPVVQEQRAALAAWEDDGGPARPKFGRCNR